MSSAYVKNLEFQDLKGTTDSISKIIFNSFVVRVTTSLMAPFLVDINTSKVGG